LENSSLASGLILQEISFSDERIIPPVEDYPGGEKAG